MKKIFLALLFCNIAIAQTGFRFNGYEYFTASVSIDPTSSVKEHGLDIVSELEFVGKGGYVKVGLESFSVLEGGYTDFHAGAGVSFTTGMHEDWRFYTGVRVSCVFRDGGHGVNPGLEGGIDYDVLPNLAVGLRGTYDYRAEQEIIFNWKPETKLSGFIRVSYKWYFKGRSPK